MSQRTFTRELAGQFGQLLRQLPAGLQKQLSDLVQDWDVLTEDHRRIKVEALDRSQASYVGIIGTDEEFDRWAEVLMKRADIEYEIAKREALPAPIPSEWKIKEELLQPFRHRLDENDSELDRMKTVPSDKTLPEDEMEKQCHEPRLRMGTNSRAEFKAWVEWETQTLYEEGDTLNGLAERIRARAKECGYYSERYSTAPSVNSIIRMIPPGITGGRQKNGRRSGNNSACQIKFTPNHKRNHPDS